jgi:uncharacterized membrane protein required for colicin V production
MAEFIVSLKNLLDVILSQIQNNPSWADIMVAGVLGLCVLQGLLRGLVSAFITAMAVTAGYLLAKSQWALDLMSKYTGLENPLVLSIAVFLAIMLLGTLVRRSMRNIFRSGLILNLGDRLAGGFLGLMIGCAIIVVGSDLVITHFGTNFYENQFSSKTLEATRDLAEKSGATKWLDMFTQKSKEYAEKGASVMKETLNDPKNREGIEDWVKTFMETIKPKSAEK